MKKIFETLWGWFCESYIWGVITFIIVWIWPAIMMDNYPGGKSQRLN